MARAKVLKFGGTSMGSADAIRQVVAIVRRPQKDARIAAVVVSAMSGVTNQLIEIAQLAAKKDPHFRKQLKALQKRHLDTLEELTGKRDGYEWADVLFRHLESAVIGVSRLRQLSPGALDYIMSFGERLSGHILVEALQSKKTACEYLNARDVIVTDGHFGSASVDFAATDKAVRAHFKRHAKLQVATGFIAATPDRQTTTLGRGGSDYSAAIIGAAIGARAIEIWTDVSGILTADPRLVPDAKVVPELAFEEAAELAYFGAKVLHPKTILPAMRKKIPVKVLNTFAPKDAGTTIVADLATRRAKSQTIDALTFKRPVLAMHVSSPQFFDVNGFMARIFEIFDFYRTSVDVITTSVTSASFTIDDERHVRKIVKEIGQLGEVTIERRKAIICAVGGGLDSAGVAGRLFTILGKYKIPVEMISQEAGSVSITFVVRAKDAPKVLKILHKEYIT